MRKSRKYLIYGLVDPRTDEIRYVGKSCTGWARPKSHWYPSSLVSRSYKNSWIKQLKSLGLMYRIRILATPSHKEDLDQLEIDWIKKGFAKGWPLTNLVAGGEGRGHPTEHYRKLAQRFTGVPRSPKVYAKLLAAAKNRCGVPRAATTVKLLSQAAIRQFSDPVNRIKTSRAKGGKPFTDQYGQRFETLMSAERLLGVPASNICAVLHGRRTNAGGRVFEYCHA